MTPPPPSRHSLRGRVVDADGETPQPPVIFGLRGGHGGAALPTDLHPVGWSDREGGFDVAVLPGPAVVTAGCPGYETGDVAVEVPAGGLPDAVTLRLKPRELLP